MPACCWKSLLITLTLLAPPANAQVPTAAPAVDQAWEANSQRDGWALQADPETIAAPLPEPLMTREEFEGLAFRNHPALSEARARIEAARGRWVQGGLYPNPVIGYAGMEMGNANTSGQQGGFVSQQFILGGKLRLNREVAAQEIRLAQRDYDAQELRVLTDVRSAFNDVLIAQRRVDLAREFLGVSREAADVSRRLLEGRQVPLTDVLQAEIESQQAEILFSTSSQDQQAAWRRLTAVSGVPDLAVLRVTGPLPDDLPERDWEESIALLASRSPELAAARARVGRAEWNVSRAQAQVVPDVNLWVSVRRIAPTDSDSASVQAGLPVPIFDRNQGGIREAQADLVAARMAARRLELQLQERLATVWRGYANSADRVRIYQTQILPRATQSLDLAAGGYREGQTDYLTLLTTQRTYLQVNLVYLDALREAGQNEALLDGLLLSGSLQPAPNMNR